MARNSVHFNCDWNFYFSSVVQYIFFRNKNGKEKYINLPYIFHQALDFYLTDSLSRCKMSRAIDNKQFLAQNLQKVPFIALAYHSSAAEEKNRPAIKCLSLAHQCKSHQDINLLALKTQLVTMVKSGHALNLKMLRSDKCFC